MARQTGSSGTLQVAISRKWPFHLGFLAADLPVIQALPGVRPNSDNIILIHSPRKGEMPKKFVIGLAGGISVPKRYILLVESLCARELIIDVARLYQYIVAPC
jgi:hypothetical protein